MRKRWLETPNSRVHSSQGLRRLIQGYTHKAPKFGLRISHKSASTGALYSALQYGTRKTMTYRASSEDSHFQESCFLCARGRLEVQRSS